MDHVVPPAEELRSIFDPLSACARANQPSVYDTAFISIGLTYTKRNREPSDIGISFLDSQFFRGLVYNVDSHNAERGSHSIISTYHYTLSRSRQPDHRAKKCFRSGEIHHIPISNRLALNRVLTEITCHHSDPWLCNGCCVSNKFFPAGMLEKLVAQPIYASEQIEY